MLTPALIGLALGAVIGVVIPEPCDPGKVVCPDIPLHSLQFAVRLQSQLEARPNDDAVQTEHDEYLRLVFVLAKNCGGA